MKGWKKNYLLITVYSDRTKNYLLITVYSDRTKFVVLVNVMIKEIVDVFSCDPPIADWRVWITTVRFKHVTDLERQTYTYK